MNELEQQKNEMIVKFISLSQALDEAYKTASLFYNKMRFEKTGLTPDEYERLYDEGKVYTIEETEIFYRMEELMKALSEIKEEKK